MGGQKLACGLRPEEWGLDCQEQQGEGIPGRKDNTYESKGAEEAGIFRKPFVVWMS